MYYVGIDIGSTASKTVVTGDREMKFVLPTGWSSKETASEIASRLLDEGIDVMSEGVRVAATGYGRVAVNYADFEQTLAVYGLSETCNRLFFCGLTENERSLFKKRYDRIEKVTPKDIYNALNTNIFYNPVRLVM